jgi:sugar/nucleoside kinase (ribokinase family)
MSILVVGSVAFDTIATPSGRVKDILGGAATYFALAASYFTEVRMVAVVGEDFTRKRSRPEKSRRGHARHRAHQAGKTFRWGGQYLDNLNEAKTDFTELNVFEKFQPRIPKEYADTQFLFLANIHPTLQKAVRLEMRGAPDGRRHHEFLDPGHAQELAETLKLVNVLLINDTETKMLAGEKNLPRAAAEKFSPWDRARWW